MKVFKTKNGIKADGIGYLIEHTPPFVKFMEKMKAEGVELEYVEYTRTNDPRSARNRALKLADIAINKLEDEGKDAKAWRKYRVALRDWPESKDFPDKLPREPKK